MKKRLITLPCTAGQLEIALHAICDHSGCWTAEISVDGMPAPDVPFNHILTIRPTTDTNRKETEK